MSQHLPADIPCNNLYVFNPRIHNLIKSPYIYKFTLHKYTNPVAYHLNVRDYVRTEEDRLTIAFQSQDDISYLLSPYRVKPRHRFIKNYKVRLVYHSLSYADPLEHAFGKLSKLCICSIFKSHK